MFPKEVYINRRTKLKEKVKSGLAIFLGNEYTAYNYPANPYHFRQDSNFLYFLGINRPHFVGVIDFDEGKDWVLGDDFEIDDIIWMGPQPSVRELAAEAGVSNTAPYAFLYDMVRTALAAGRQIHILPPYRGEQVVLLNEVLQDDYKNYVSEELIKAVVALRSVKDSYEIAEIEKAIEIGYEMHVTAMRMCEPGVSEQKIAAAVEAIPIANGGRISFPVILSQNGEILHNHYHGNILQAGKMLLTDAGAETEMGYASDFTRTVPVSGQFDERQKAIYSIVLEANKRVIELSKPGVRYLDMHLEAAKVIASGLKDLGIMKGDVDEAVTNGAHALFFPHGLGHMMGLDVHDMEGLGENYVGYDDTVKRSDQFGLAYLRLAKKLEPGYVLTDEPGIYFIPALIDLWRKDGKHKDFINYDEVEKYKDFGGIRIEDDLLITENGCEVMGKRIPKEIDEIEQVMKA